MEEIVPLVRSLLALICLIVAVPLLALGSAGCAYFTLRLVHHRRPELPRSWHTLWGLNHANLLFFPSQLDEAGLKYHAKARKWGIRMLLGAAIGMLAFLFSGRL
jgi:hypothetical protein